MNRYLNNKSSIAASRVFSLGGWGLLALLGFDSRAWAGTWEVHSYVYSGVRHSEREEFRVVGGETEHIREINSSTAHGGGNPETTFNKASTLEGRWKMGARVSWQANGSFGPTVRDFQESTASVEFEVRPVFKWRRDDPNDLNDNPIPKQELYIYERASIDTYPFQGSGLENGLKSGVVHTPMTPDAGGRARANSLADGTRFKRIRVDKLRKTATGEIVFDGPGVYFKGTMNVPAFTLHPGGTDSGAITCDYFVRIVSFSLHGRRMKTSNETQPEAFGDLASIAAGQIDSPEHKADIRMQVHVPSAGEAPGHPDEAMGLANIPKSKLPKILVEFEESNTGKDPKLEDAKPSEGPGTHPVDKTDDKGFIVPKYLHSGERVTIGNKFVKVKIDPKVYIPRYYSPLTVVQGWASIQWAMGENGEKPWDPKYFAGIADHKDQIWAKATFGHAARPYPQPHIEIPLTGHTMKFVVKHLEVYEKKDNGFWIKRVYTNDRNLKIENFPGFDEMIYQDELDVDHYVKFTPATATTDNKGVVKTEMTITKDPMRQVTKIIPELEDQAVYGQ